MNNETLIIGSENHCIEISDTGAKIIGSLSLDQFKDTLRNLKRVKQVYHLALADVVKYGRSEFGAEAVNETLSQLEFDLSDSYRALSIARLSDGTRAVSDVSPEHQYVIGRAFPNEPEKQEQWARVAVDERLSASDLKMSISNGTVTRARDRVSGFISFEAVVSLFSRCAKAVKDIQLTEADKANIVNILSPIVKFSQSLQTV